MQGDDEWAGPVPKPLVSVMYVKCLHHCMVNSMQAALFSF